MKVGASTLSSLWSDGSVGVVVVASAVSSGLTNGCSGNRFSFASGSESEDLCEYSVPYMDARSLGDMCIIRRGEQVKMNGLWLVGESKMASPRSLGLTGEPKFSDSTSSGFVLMFRKFSRR